MTAERAAEGWIVFQVSDTGIGITAENLERIFEEFVQIEGELQSQVKGTGLGLPLSRRLAALLGGTLDVESSPGYGSTFTLRIPAQFGQSQPETPLSLPIDADSGLAILFIEDNRETSFVHQSALKTAIIERFLLRTFPKLASR